MMDSIDGKYTGKYHYLEDIMVLVLNEYKNQLLTFSPKLVQQPSGSTAGRVFRLIDFLLYLYPVADRNQMEIEVRLKIKSLKDSISYDLRFMTAFDCNMLDSTDHGKLFTKLSNGFKREVTIIPETDAVNILYNNTDQKVDKVDT